MLGLATVLTEQGMEGIVPFAPPASARPKAAEPVVDVSADDASEISMGTWITVAQPDRQAKAAHGTFDNDVAVVSRALERISGGALKTPVDDLRGF